MAVDRKASARVLERLTNDAVLIEQIAAKTAEDAVEVRRCMVGDGCWIAQIFTQGVLVESHYDEDSAHDVAVDEIKKAEGIALRAIHAYIEADATRE